MKIIAKLKSVFDRDSTITVANEPQQKNCFSCYNAIMTGDGVMKCNEGMDMCTDECELMRGLSNDTV